MIFAGSERAVCILGETNSAALVVSNELLALINLDAGRLELVDHSACWAASTRNARSSDERLEEVVTTPTAARAGVPGGDWTGVVWATSYPERPEGPVCY